MERITKLKIDTIKSDNINDTRENKRKIIRISLEY